MPHARRCLPHTIHATQYGLVSDKLAMKTRHLFSNGEHQRHDRHDVEHVSTRELGPGQRDGRVNEDNRNREDQSLGGFEGL